MGKMGEKSEKGNERDSSVKFDCPHHFRQVQLLKLAGDRGDTHALSESHHIPTSQGAEQVAVAVK